MALLPLKNQYLCMDSVFEVILKSPQFANWHGYVNYQQVLSKVTEPELTRYFVKSSFLTQMFNGFQDYKYYVKAIELQELVLDASKEITMEQKLVLHKHTLFTNDQIKHFCEFSPQTKAMYIEHNNQYIDVSVLRKKLQALYWPVFIDACLKRWLIKLYELSKIRYEIDPNKVIRFFGDRFENNFYRDQTLIFKLNYTIALIIFPIRLSPKMRDITLKGKWQLLHRLCSCFPVHDYTSVVAYFQNNRAKESTMSFSICLGLMKGFDARMDIGICFFIIRLIFPAYAFDFNPYITAIWHNDIGDVKRSLQAFGIVAAQNGINPVTQILYPIQPDNDFTFHLSSTDFNPFYQNKPNNDIVNDEDKDAAETINDQTVLYIYRLILRTDANFFLNKTPLQIIFEVCDHFIDAHYGLPLSYKFYYTLFFCQTPFDPTRTITTHAYLLNLQETFLKKTDFTDLPQVFQIETEVIDDIKKKLSMPPDFMVYRVPPDQLNTVDANAANKFRFLVESTDDFRLDLIVNMKSMIFKVKDTKSFPLIENVSSKLTNLNTICFDMFQNEEYSNATCNPKLLFPLTNQFISKYNYTMYCNMLWLRYSANEYVRAEGLKRTLETEIRHFVANKLRETDLKYLNDFDVLYFRTNDRIEFYNETAHGLYFLINDRPETYVPIQFDHATHQRIINKFATARNKMLPVFIKIKNSIAGVADVYTNIFHVQKR